MPIITVAITTFNLSKYIAQCLDELIQQTFQDFEIVILDDCSKDNTTEILRWYEGKYSNRIKAIYQDKNLGNPALARNRILDSQILKGQYIIFLDGDDSIEPDFLENLYHCIITNNADIACCAYNRVEDDSKKVVSTEMQSQKRAINPRQDAEVLPFINTSLWNKLIKVEIIDTIRIPEFSVGEDLCFLYRLYCRANKIAFTPKVLIHYRIRSNSVISNTSKETINQFARELLTQHQLAQDNRFKEILEMTTFIHIGISMALRAYTNPDINTKEHIRWTRLYFINNYEFFKNNTCLRLKSLLKYGVRGASIWICLNLYKSNCIIIFLLLYSFMQQHFHIEKKF